MGYIKKEVEIVGTFRSKVLNALFDSGAGRDYIRAIFYDGDMAEDLGVVEYRDIKEIILADSRIGKGEVVTFPRLKINDLIYREPEMIIMRDLSYNVIIGSFFMQEMKMNLMMGRELVERER